MRRQTGILGGVLIAAVAVVATGSLRLSAGPQAPAEPGAAAVAVGPSLVDALTRPYHFPFAKPTPIAEVAEHLARTLHANVVLDRAAMERLDVRADDPVQLELKGVRLKTGLKLLLDQLDMTYRVEAEDNLLVLTDSIGSDDPFHRILDEVKSLHHDIHGLRDDVDEIRAHLGLDEEGPRMRKPTIIEDMPPGAVGEPVKPREKAPQELPAPRPPGGRSRPGI